MIEVVNDEGIYFTVGDTNLTILDLLVLGGFHKSFEFLVISHKINHGSGSQYARLAAVSLQHFFHNLPVIR